MINKHENASQLRALAPISSKSLLNGRTEVLIEHDGEIYRLRHTSKGKLIMTK